MNVSLVFNTDGAPVFKSSGISLWPVYLVINELPPRLWYIIYPWKFYPALLAVLTQLSIGLL